MCDKDVVVKWVWLPVTYSDSVGWWMTADID